ncbi:family 78 glycoside hydrolase catalytic domain [Nocardioides sp. NPDC006303]|uniref:alpha-L-rhamnosidase n=1 Tax=Nocardioides sp. NPDC006303 TaxID=3156747 RepID=UPI0033BB2954
MTDLRIEHLDDPIGIGDNRPRLSWRIVDAEPGATQVAYEVECSGEGLATHRAKTMSGRSQLVEWSSLTLRPRQRAQIRVRIWLEDQKEPTEWSETITVEVALPTDAWSAEFVSPSQEASMSGPRPAYLLRAEFDLPEKTTRVRAYATARGVYDLLVNGREVADDVLAPGWTSYDHRLVYRTYDLDELVHPGRNALGAWLADGWFRGRLGFNGGLWDVYGRDVALLVQLEATSADGTVSVIPLTWTWAPAPITSTGLYEGEVHDQRRAAGRWATPGYDDTGWSPTTSVPRQPAVQLVPAAAPPIRVIETLRPVSIERRPGGRVRLDFGQNISGKLRFTATAPRGHVLELHHAEVLEDDELATRPLRSATSIDTYAFAGEASETWTPRFTLHGFRYAEIEGWPEGLDPAERVEALVVHSDMVRRGSFASSHELLNRFHDNVVWSMRDNFVGLPTDCPQRDERLGWTGDIQVFAPAASFLYDATGVLRSWLDDLRAEQLEHGSVRNFHPWLDCGFPADPSAGWGDAAVIVPWVLYERTGDASILRDYLSAMTDWVDQVDRLTGGTGLWNTGFQLGDWLDPHAPPERPGDSATDPYLVATAYHAHTARLVARAAEICGEDEMANHYRGIASRAKSAFQHEYLAPSGRVVSDTVTALAVAIVFDLFVDEKQRLDAGRRLATLVHQGDHLIRTGFIGTPLVCDALASTGSVDTAYHLLLQERCPSWLYPVTMGATTVWERWDSMLPDGTVNPGEMTSFNHYALGAVVDFMHRVVAGLAPGEPGYAAVAVAPRPAGGLTYATAAHDSPYGRIATSWRRTGNRFDLEVTVPVGVRATVTLPSGEGPVTVGSGTHRFGCRYRRPDDDPKPSRTWNIHDPEERLEMEAALAKQPDQNNRRTA